MSVKVMALVWDHYPNGGGEFLTALALADHADHSGGSIFPSVGSLVLKTQQGERIIRYQLKRMLSSGWLERVQEGGHGPGSTTRYRIPIERIPLGLVGRVQTLHPSPKGAIGDTEGCNPEHLRVQTVANKPSLTISKATVKPLAQPEGFAAFWNAYPKKKNKGTAERWWRRVKPDAGLFNEIMAGLLASRLSFDWTKEGGAYIPYPASWLNAKGWEDEITPVSAAPKQCSWARCQSRASRQWGPRPVCETHEAAYQRGETP